MLASRLMFNPASPAAAVLCDGAKLFEFEFEFEFECESETTDKGAVAGL